MIDLSEINEIVRHRHETGEYGRAHFEVPQAVWDAIREAAPPSTPERTPASWLSRPDFGHLMSIPVVVDETVRPGTWRLVDNSTNKVLRYGKLEASLLPVTPEDYAAWPTS